MSYSQECGGCERTSLALGRITKLDDAEKCRTPRGTPPSATPPARPPASPLFPPSVPSDSCCPVALVLSSAFFAIPGPQSASSAFARDVKASEGWIVDFKAWTRAKPGGGGRIGSSRCIRAWAKSRARKGTSAKDSILVKPIRPYSLPSIASILPRTTKKSEPFVTMSGM